MVCFPARDPRVLGCGVKEAEIKSPATHSPTAVGFWHLLKDIRSEPNGVECFLNAPLVIYKENFKSLVPFRRQLDFSRYVSKLHLF